MAALTAQLSIAYNRLFRINFRFKTPATAALLKTKALKAFVLSANSCYLAGSHGPKYDELKEQQEKYRLLGVDPGTNILGYAIVEVEQKKLRLLDMGVIYLKKLEEQQEKLQHIFERLQSIIEIHRPTEMAIEAPFFGKNPQSMLKLGRAQGVAIAAAMTKGVGITEYSPKKIKQSVTGNGNASKEQVAAMLANILDFQIGGHYLDATDALATAVCHFYQSGSMLQGKKRYSDWGSFLKDNPGRKG
ncbi:MAG: crossover junction endodeoxyribonuclease RuvC [Phaeodactylibacter sp.]|nr:crossover junction endodeoxyribonuclease RuvC [Phaeodactylibacter sp.]MCB9273701.1 crossover junction endodeoxyribonuclease RuvC [Lewinellaceae bacterium]